MHELSIAQSVIETVTEHVSAHGGGRVQGVTLRIGALSGVDAGALRFSFDVATVETLLEGARLEIEEVPAAAYCPACDAERTLAGIQRLRCPVCGAPTPRILRGRELEILEVELAPDEGVRMEAAAAPAPLTA